MPPHTAARLTFAVALCAAFSPASSQQTGQQTQQPLPDAPAPLILPKSNGVIPPFSSGRVVADSDHMPPPPPAPVEEEEWCSAPSDSGWSKAPMKESERAPYQVLQWARWSSPAPIRENVEFEWSKYIAAYYRQTNQHFKVPMGVEHVKQNTKVQIRFNLQQDGSVTDAAVMMSSGKKNYDKSALDSVLKSSPYKQLPDGVEAPVKFCVVFNFNPYVGRKGPDDPFATKSGQP